MILFFRKNNWSTQKDLEQFTAGAEVFVGLVYCPWEVCLESFTLHPPSIATRYNETYL